uniref:SAM-dependent MTase RsmB/NOP-type domain-containing protein n=1 Tax=Plectus sambesii TaxID=2011161 RepID=A0A914UQ82_9BILA
MGRHGIRGKDRKKNKKPNGFPRNYELVAHDRTSEAFVKFYQAQGIIPPEEWDAFIAALKRELPSSFRLVGCKKEADVLRDILNTRYISQLEGVKVEEEEIEPPKPLPWYPNNLAYQMKMSRTVIRKNTILNKLHNFLVTETELGNISRQETVSMIPPLLLDVEPHHKVFDMCAAPGSKTMQLIEMLHSAGDSQAVPEGFVLANDVDNTRCYLLVHQALKRMPTPCALVVNHDATSMPRIRIDEAESANSAKFLTFDRVLCDVVCSGDGTLRKNPDLWRKWNPNLGNGVHK